MKDNSLLINDINETLKKQQEIIELDNLKGHNIIFIIDMVNGFCQKGSLASPEINKIVQPIEVLVKKAIKNKIKLIAFNDNHNEHSPEFHSYPSHCLEDSEEAQLVKELMLPEVKVIKKNSTNGFFAFDFKPNLQWDNVIIVGCCTDICVYQFALSCKAWFNQHNREANVIVPMSMTATYNNKIHSSEFFNQLSWYSMSKNGVKVVKNIN